MKIKKETNTLKNLYDRKKNIFTLISFIMSIIIIYGHSYVLYFGSNTIKIDIFSYLLKYPIGEIVVDIFLIYSGFNIISSLLRSDSYIKFFLKRILKIIPELLISLLVAAFIITPIVLKIPFLTYLKTPSYYFKYIFDNIILIKPTIYSISNVFNNLPYPNVLNGSIWTIKHIFACYLIIAFLKKIKFLDKRKNILILTIIFLITNIFINTGILNSYLNIISTKLSFIGILGEFTWFIRLLYFFLTGVCLNLYQDKIKVNIYIIISILLMLTLARFTNLTSYSLLLFLPYLSIILGSIKLNIKQIDISYTIYVFGFLIQQFIMFLFPKINFFLFNILAIFITILISYINYLLIDKSIIKLRKRLNL